jgi:hypothetical protein
MFRAGESLRCLLAEEPPRGSAAGIIVCGFKRNVTICPKTEDHAKGPPQWHEAEKQEERYQKRPWPRHGRILCGRDQ